MGVRYALIGEEGTGARMLRQLHDRGAAISCVLSAGPVARLAEQLGYHVLPPERVADPAFADELDAVDVLLNVHSLYIVAPEVLERASLGAFNVHPGPLPERAGLNPVSWAIYEGASEYGVTVHWMEPGIDTGPIAMERRFPLSGRETGLTLGTRCAQLEVELVLEVAEVLSRNDIPDRKPQDLSRRVYHGREVPGDGRVSWCDEVRSIERFVRACDYGPYPSPWGRPVAELEGIEVKLVGAREVDCPRSAPPGTCWRKDARLWWVRALDGWLEVRVAEPRGSLGRV